MKIIIAAGSALALAFAASTAQAADVAAPATYDWTGFYAGVNAGAAWNNTSVDQEHFYYGAHIGPLEDQFSSNQAAFTGGAMLGYNWQMEQIVLGAEADLSYLGFDDQRHRSDYAFRAPNGDDVTASNNLSFKGDWFGTVRARLGYAFDNVMIYGTGGLAYGHMEADSQLAIDGPEGLVTYDGSASTTNVGWTVGGGVEYGLAQWTLGAEYLFLDLGSAEWDGDFSRHLDGVDAKGSVDYQFSVVRATAKLRF